MEYNFTKSLDLYTRLLDGKILRHQILSNNIANAETPNFKKSYLNFESKLKTALNSEVHTGISAKKTDPRHMPFQKTVDYKTVLPRKYNDMFSQTDNNGNNVDIEEESAKVTKNILSYNIALSSVKSMFSDIRTVLK